MRDTLLKVLHTTPILKLLLPLIGGIIAAQNISVPLWILGILIMLALTGIFILTFRTNFYNLAWYYFTFIFFFTLGIIIWKIQLTASEDHALLKKSKHFVGIVTSLPEPVSYGLRYDFRIIYYHDDQFWKTCNANILLYIKKNVKPALEPGQYVCLKNASIKLQYSQPLPFNQSQSDYYFRQNVSGLIFIEQSDKLIAFSFQSNNLYCRIQQLRKQILTLTDTYFASISEKSIFQSLFLGYRAEMDSELRQAYATAGVIHILSVSGLHVGIIYLFFLFLTAPLKYQLLFRIIRTIIITVALWFYGILAGFSPPVIRSCAMFTLLGLTQLFQRESFSFNNLFLSAFIILLFAPQQLFDVGFQLSYAAMTGIFLFYKPFTRVISSNIVIGKKIGELIAVSVAAQLGTLPFSLYYFNSFPLYFILSNLVIVPFTTLIMYVGIVFLILIPIPSIAAIAAALLTKMIILLNEMVIWVEHLPYASLKGFYPNLFEATILGGIILTLAYLIYFKNFKIIPLLMALVVLYQIAEIVKYLRGHYLHQIVITQTYPADVICYLYHNQLICITLDTPPKFLAKHLDNYRKHYYFHNLKIICFKHVTKQTDHKAHKIQIGDLTIHLSERFPPKNRIYFVSEKKPSFFSQRYLLTIESPKHKLLITEKIPNPNQNGYYLINLK